MNRYARRLFQSVFTLFVVITITFVLYRMMPNGPIEAMQQQLVSEALAKGENPDMSYINHMVAIRTGIDPNTPMHVAYYEYMRDIILYQDFGQSIAFNAPVFEVLFYAMPWTVLVSVYGILIGFTTNIILGAVMAYYEGSIFDTGSTIVAIVLNSIPYYVGAIVFLAFLAFQWGLFPTGGRMYPDSTAGFNWYYIQGVIHHAALPILSSVLIGFGGTALSMRGNCIRVMGSNYLRVARLRGLSDGRIAVRYVGRNAILPLYTQFMIGLAGIFSGSIIMEQIFTYPGVGWYTYDALVNRDYPLLMGILIFFSVITVVGVLIADLTYGLIDPRANTGEKEGY